jgi:hypothetical protein
MACQTYHSILPDRLPPAIVAGTWRQKPASSTTTGSAQVVRHLGQCSFVEVDQIPNVIDAFVLEGDDGRIWNRHLGRLFEESRCLGCGEYHLGLRLINCSIVL